MKKFRDLFVFDPAKAMWVGVEREVFITNRHGTIVPKAEKVLDCAYHYHFDFGSGESWSKDERFGYELSACQVEGRTEACQLGDIKKELQGMEESLSKYLKETKKGLRLSYSEVAPETMPLDVYPDPSGRYQEIVKKMPREVLLAACRVIGTHVHVGMPDHETALKVYNAVIGQTDQLCQMGDRSNGERLKIYKVVAPDCRPPVYKDWQDFHTQAVAKGFDTDPRKCWTLIRISKHGTIEFRMFGATADIGEIVRWVRHCHSLCKRALLGEKVSA